MLAEVEPHVRPGVTTDELDAIGHEAIVRRGGYPSPLGYLGYPASICTAVNEVICHGIPGPLQLAEGDIVGIDVTVYLDGVHGDLCKTFPVGASTRCRRACSTPAARALAAGMSAVEPGRPVNAIGRAIEKELRGRYGIVREFVGHEIGRDFHGALIVPHGFEAAARTCSRRAWCSPSSRWWRSARAAPGSAPTAGRPSRATAAGRRSSSTPCS